MVRAIDRGDIALDWLAIVVHTVAATPEVDIQGIDLLDRQNNIKPVGIDVRRSSCEVGIGIYILITRRESDRDAPRVGEVNGARVDIVRTVDDREVLGVREVCELDILVLS